MSTNSIKGLEPIVPARPHRSRWSDDEHALLHTALESGYGLEQIQGLFPLRSKQAILTKAVNIGYRSETDKEGDIHLFLGVVKRNRRTKAEIEADGSKTNMTCLAPTLSLSDDVSPDQILSYRPEKDKDEKIRELVSQILSLLDDKVAV